MTDSLISVRLREGRKPKRFLLSSEYDVQIGDWVVASHDEEEDFGRVESRPIPTPEAWEEAELPSVTGIPSAEEVAKAVELRKQIEPDAIKHAYPRVRERNLDLKLVSAFYYLRSNKLRFYFCSENRVDFRDLVKDLAHLFHARIEMKQIGVRDAAGLVGGYGLCGQELCCTRFLKGFDPITIKMAKDQNLALNPSKISGCCGRLLCCLKYEHQTYVDAQRHFPRLGSAGRDGDRTLKVVSYNLIKETVGMMCDNQVREVPLEDFKHQNPEWRNAPKYSQYVAGLGTTERAASPITTPQRVSSPVREEAAELVPPPSPAPEPIERDPQASGGDGPLKPRRRRRNRGRRGAE